MFLLGFFVVAVIVIFEYSLCGRICKQTEGTGGGDDAIIGTLTLGSVQRVEKDEGEGLWCLTEHGSYADCADLFCCFKKQKNLEFWVKTGNV